MNSLGSPLSAWSHSLTAIPLTAWLAITQTSLSPETIAASLNKAERSYSSELKMPHGNALRVYPFWKICKVCSTPFPCRTKEQAVRNLTCSRGCAAAALRGPREHKPMHERLGMIELTCPCGTKFWRPRAWTTKIATPHCSRECNGTDRGKEWAKHGHKGSAAVTPEGRASAIAKMTGANNPAWKGGVTIFKTHGNYVGVRYVRCSPEFAAMARKDGYVMEHRLLVAQAIGRCLTRIETVHHYDHDPTHNALTNLALFRANQDHKLFEHHGSPLPIWSLSNPSDMTALHGVSRSRGVRL